jgi:hypothetical protein
LSETLGVGVQKSSKSGTGAEMFYLPLWPFT